jgi:acyl carrier protein
MPSDINASVRRFIGENFLFREDVQSIRDDDSFMDAGIIDSTGVLELVFFLEATYGIEVGDEEIVPENIDSIGAIVRYVQGKLSAGPVRAAEQSAMEQGIHAG